MQTFRRQLDLNQPLGRVNYHGRAIFGPNGATYIVHLVLFDAALVFIPGSPPSPPQVKRVLLPSRIVSITSPVKDEIFLTQVAEYDGSIDFFDFRFTPKEPGTDVATWLQMLRTFAPNASTSSNLGHIFHKVAATHDRL